MRFIELVKKFGIKVQEEGLLYTVQFTYDFFRREFFRFLYQRARLHTTKLPFIKGLRKGNPTAVTKAKKYISAPLDAVISIEGHCHCLYGHNTDFSGSRAVVIAHWDPDNTIDVYVEYLCKHFKDLGFKVVISSANPIENTLVARRWQNYADAIVYRTCDGYDFTSWKAALACFPSLYQCEELTLTNDSFFGPIGSFAPVYERMEKISCDFWGLTYSQDEAPHIQSFFMVFHKNVLQDAAFSNFIAAVPLDSSRKKAIAFELSLGIYFTMHGFQGATYAQAVQHILRKYNLATYCYDKLIDYGVPVLKRETLRRNSLAFKAIIALESGEFKGYPLEFCHEYFLRIGLGPRGVLTAGKQYPTFPPDVLCLFEKIDLTPMVEKPKEEPFAVALHCFYPECLPDLEVYLRNLPHYAHIFITTDTEEKKEEILRFFAKMTFDAIEVRICPNLGWDVAPFYISLQDVIKKYPLLLKIHVKKSTHVQGNFTMYWKNSMYGSLMGSKEHIENILQYLQNNEHMGVIAPTQYPPCMPIIQGFNNTDMSRLLKHYNITLPHNTMINFPAGTMFWCRTKALYPWLNVNLQYDDFPPTTKRDGTLAHALERLIFFGCGIEGLRWGKVGMPKGVKL